MFTTLIMSSFTYWGPNKMATILQMTFSIDVLWWKSFILIKIAPRFVAGIQLIMSEHCLRLGPNRCQAITLTKCWPRSIMPQDLTDDKSTLVQVMAWCHQAASHYLNQCWPSEWVSEWFSLTAFLRTADIEVHIVHTSRVDQDLHCLKLGQIGAKPLL